MWEVPCYQCGDKGMLCCSKCNLLWYVFYSTLLHSYILSYLSFFGTFTLSLLLTLTYFYVCIFFSCVLINTHLVNRYCTVECRRKINSFHKRILLLSYSLLFSFPLYFIFLLFSLSLFRFVTTGGRVKEAHYLKPLRHRTDTEILKLLIF